MEKNPLSVSEVIDLVNQTLDYAYPAIAVEGEVAEFKVNQNKYVFFSLKDEAGSLPCFMMVYNLRVPLEDGMRVRLIAKPNLTKWGKFSLTVRDIVPAGEGSIKKAFDILKSKLDKEGLFSAERKRPLPELPKHIGVISSTQAAGYGDFIKILSNRWGGLDIVVAHTQVQGLEAPRQIINAIKQLNELSEPPEVIAIIRGGGSADDLAVFNDEALVRAVAASRIPIISGVGHEVDETLIDFVADVRAATPSNAAEQLVPDRRAVAEQTDSQLQYISSRMRSQLVNTRKYTDQSVFDIAQAIIYRHEQLNHRLVDLTRTIEELNPRRVLQRGYALLRDSKSSIVTQAAVGDEVIIETKQSKIIAEVTDVTAINN